MESTSTSWKPPFYLLEESCACWLVNARDLKHAPGRPKTDTQDAVWPAKLAERGMLRPSFAPPPWQRELRDLTRYRRTRILSEPGRSSARSRLLEDAQINLSAVAADMFGVSGRQLLEALIAGQRPEGARAAGTGQDALQAGRLGRGAHRALPRHHGYLLGMLLDRIDALGAQADQLTGRIDRAARPVCPPGGAAG
jgi:transposase